MPEGTRVKRWVRKAATTAPHRTAAIVGRRLAGTASLAVGRVADGWRSTYLSPTFDPVALKRRMATDSPLTFPLDAQEAAVRAATGVLEHRFDLLGSGPVVVAYGTTCAGIEGIVFPHGVSVDTDEDGTWLVGRLPQASTGMARTAWRLVDAGYMPIDWQLDFKSGYRWSERTWSRDIRFGDVRGADVKVPWELARMQHLPLLALLAAATGVNGNLSERCRREFRNEVLDFIATNPPRFGVNWNTTMDVAIRVGNWLIARDLFLAGGAEFDQPFEEVLGRSVREHGRHIAANLEWTEQLRSNHYLADVVGLLFVAAYLPPDGETDHWLALARREVIAEGLSQFHNDGSNFEASTSYHRLSGEMLAYAVALLLGLDAQSDAVPQQLAERLQRAAEFTIDLTKPSGHVAQIGDNDSGRFVKLGPAEESLDHRGFVAAVAGLVDRADFDRFAGADRPERAVTRSLARGRRLPPLDPQFKSHSVGIGGRGAVEAADGWLNLRTADRRVTFRISIPGGLGESLHQVAYPDFGAFVLRSDRCFLAIRCGPVGQNGFGGHAHNDQLAIELQVDGEDWLRDPGSYVYTPFPERRNIYRSGHAHAGPPLASEPASLDLGLFTLGSGTSASCDYWGNEGFAGRVQFAGGRIVVGRVAQDNHGVLVTYGVEGDRFRPVADDWRALAPAVAFSPGYGVLEG